MTQYRIPLQLNYGRDKADGSGMQPASGVGYSFVTGRIDQTFAAGYTLQFDVPRWAHIVEAEIFFTGGFLGTLRTLHGRSDWAITRAIVAGDLAILANGGVAFDDDSRGRVTVGGDSAIVTGGGDSTLQAVAKWKLGPAGGFAVPGVPSASGATVPQWSSALYSEYADTALSDDPPIGDLRGLFNRQEQLLQTAGGGNASLVLSSGSVQLGFCNAAFTDPFGKVFLRASDIGAGVGQIPTDTANWLASQFRAHPSVFARFGDHVRAYGTALQFGPADALALAGATPVSRLYEVTRSPTFSTWLLVIDGLPTIVTFPHPAGSDLRRPSEIWNAVIVPAILQRSGAGTPGIAGSSDDGVGTPGGIGPAMTFEAMAAVGIIRNAALPFGANVFRQRESLPRRMKHLQYGRCLELWDSQSIYDDPPYTEVVLNGGG